MRIALAANGRMGLGLLRALQGSRHHVVALVRDGRPLSGMLRPVSGLVRWADHMGGVAGGPWTVEGRAWSAGVPTVWLREQGPAEAEALRRLEPDLLLVGNFGIILRQSILDVPGVGTVNTHWSLLPRHRGPSPSTSVLLAGESETGVSFHVVDTRIDAGAVLDQVAFPIGPDDTATSLYNRACDEAERRVVDLVDRIEEEGLVGEPQDLGAGSYWKKITVERARLDFTREAAELDRKVRALTSPLPWFLVGRRRIYVSAARAVAGVDAPPGTIVSLRPQPVIACGQGGLAIAAGWTLVPPMPWPPPLGGPRVGDVVG